MRPSSSRRYGSDSMSLISWIICAVTLHSFCPALGSGGDIAARIRRSSWRCEGASRSLSQSRHATSRYWCMANSDARRMQMHAGSARAHAIFNDPWGPGCVQKSHLATAVLARLRHINQTGHLSPGAKWLYSTFRNAWTFWELPNLLPYGRLRRRTFKCFEHLCVFKDFINTTPTWNKTHALHLDRNSQLHLVSSTELK
jgi:hypothetical protein